MRGLHWSSWLHTLHKSAVRVAERQVDLVRVGSITVVVTIDDFRRLYGYMNSDLSGVAHQGQQVVVVAANVEAGFEVCL